MAVLLLPVKLSTSASKTDGCVVVSGSVVKEREITDGCVVNAGCQMEKRTIALGGIAAGIASVGCRNNPESVGSRRKCKRRPSVSAMRRRPRIMCSALVHRGIVLAVDGESVFRGIVGLELDQWIAWNEGWLSVLVVPASVVCAASCG